MTAAILVRQPIERGATERVVGLVTDRLCGHEDVGPAAIVPSQGVHTASIFLGEPVEGPDSLVWYLEIEPGSRAWAEPPETTVRGSPLYEDGLSDRVASPAAWDVHSAENGGLAVHATLAGRPRSVATASGVAQVAVRGGDAEPALDVVLLRASIHPGLADWLVRSFVRVMRRLDAFEWIERRVDDWTQPVLEEEGMYTESIFLERTPAGSDLVWYMEVADFAAAVDVYQETPNLVARISDAVLSRVFENHEVLNQRDPASEYDLLAHAVSPDRP